MTDYLKKVAPSHIPEAQAIVVVQLFKILSACT